MTEKHKTKNISKKRTSGITLIALVVTIIVLLILAGIAIMMLTGENGILTRAVEAKEQTIVGQEKESVELAYLSAAMKKLGDNVTANDLQDELDVMLGDTGETDATKKKTTVKQKPRNILSVLFRETQHNYNVKNGQVTKTLEDGIYVGNVRLSGLYLPDVNNMSYEDYRSSISQEDENISSFFYKCYSKTATNSDYKNAIDDAETAGISRDWIDYAYNNQGDRIRNIQAPTYNIDRTGEYSWDISIPVTGDITSEDQNFKFDINLDIMYGVTIQHDAETNDYRDMCTGFPRNPEAISCRYIDSNKEIPDEIQLPFGMVLKKNETLIQTLYEQAITWMSSEQDAMESAICEACVIDWQGQTFTIDELREYFSNNTKIVYNGQTVNISSYSPDWIHSPGILHVLFDINFCHLYETGYLP